MERVLHALCDTHHLRELKALIEIEKEEWVRRMQRLLRRACHAVNVARERGLVLQPVLIELFESRYYAIVAQGLKPRRRSRGGQARGAAANGADESLAAELLARLRVA